MTEKLVIVSEAGLLEAARQVEIASDVAQRLLEKLRTTTLEYVVVPQQPSRGDSCPRFGGIH